MKAIAPVFSGGIDTLINKLDTKKIMSFNDATPTTLRIRANM